MLSWSNIGMANIVSDDSSILCDTAKLQKLLESGDVTEVAQACSHALSNPTAISGKPIGSSQFKASALHQSAAGAAGCSASDHDMIVASIESLRTAVATAAPGSVIGIDGPLDINSDGEADILVSAPGITITCASNDAGLFGEAVVAVLQVLANDVTIEHLNVEAEIERGIQFTDVDNGEAINNKISCERTCINVLGTTNTLADGNDITQGFKLYGIAGSNNRGLEVRNNSIAGCWFCVALIVGDIDSLIEANTVEACDASCIYSLDSMGVRVVNNFVRNGLAPIWALGSTDLEFIGNDVSGCDFGCIRVEPNTFIGELASNVYIIDNTLLDCASKPSPLGAGSCMSVYSVDGVVIDENELQNRRYGAVVYPAAIIGEFSFDVKVRKNHIDSGLLYADGTLGLHIEDNTLLNTSIYVKDAFNYPVFEKALIRANRITVESGVPDPAIFINGTDSVEITGNTILGSIAQGVTLINVRETQNQGSAAISGNEIDIHWQGYASGLDVSGIGGSRISIEHNRIRLSSDSPESVGIAMSGQVLDQGVYLFGQFLFRDYVFDPIRDGVVANNRVAKAAIGLLVNGACSNTFLGNNFKGASTEAVFTQQSFSETFSGPFTFIGTSGGTGDNVVNGGSVITEATRDDEPVEGDGYLDCDEDGFSDPNYYTGPTANAHPGLGEVLGNILSAARSR
jgi:hypothetical protein